MTTSEFLKNFPLLFATILVAILFLQSGLDKIFNYKGNLEWLTSHFAKSPLGGTVGLMLPVQRSELVGAVACRWGWVSHSRFAVACQQRFGVLPSRTLRS